MAPILSKAYESFGYEPHRISFLNPWQFITRPKEIVEWILPDIAKLNKLNKIEIGTALTFFRWISAPSDRFTNRRPSSRSSFHRLPHNRAFYSKCVMFYFAALFRGSLCLNCVCVCVWIKQLVDFPDIHKCCQGNVKKVRFFKCKFDSTILRSTCLRVKVVHGSTAVLCYN